MFIEDDNFISDQGKYFLKLILSGDYPFPFKYMPDSVSKDTNSFLSHSFIERVPTVEHEPVSVGGFTKLFTDIADEFLKKHNLEVKKYCRGSVNLTFNNGADKCPTHYDHDYDHHQLIIYANEPKDKDSKLVILDDDEKTILHEIEPTQYKGVLFNRKPHFHYYPKFGDRIAIIYTFILKQ